MNIKTAVIGGSGKAGTYLTNTLIQRGLPHHPLLRNPENLQVSDPLSRIFHGDARNEEVLQEMLEGCEAVISTLGQTRGVAQPVFSEVTNHLIQVMKSKGIRRYIVVGGLNVDTPGDEKSGNTLAATVWMKQHFPAITADRQKEYEMLAASDLDWTFVRLPVIEQTEERRGIRTNLTDCPGDKVSASDLADFLICQLEDRTFIGKAPFLSSL